MPVTVVSNKYKNTLLNRILMMLGALLTVCNNAMSKTPDRLLNPKWITISVNRLNHLLFYLQINFHEKVFYLIHLFLL